MKKLTLIPVLLFFISCQNRNTASEKNTLDSIKTDSVKVLDGVEIVKGWNDSIYKDTIYTLRIKGCSDSTRLYSPMIGAGGVMTNKGNGNYEFRLKNDNDADSLSIIIMKSSVGPAENENGIKQYRKISIPVKKIK